MTDIVARLRQPRYHETGRELQNEAADEIERLRAALRGLLEEWDKLSRYGSPMAKAANERVNVARRALEGK